MLTKLDHIGDFILFSTGIRAIRDCFPEYCITLLVQDCTYQCAELCPYVDEVWHINQRDFRRNPLSRFRWALKIRNGHFDIAINAVYSSSVDFFDCLIGFTHACRRVGFGEDRSTRGWPYYTELVKGVQPSLFEIDKTERLLRYLNFKGDMGKIPEVWIDDDDLNTAHILLSEVKDRPYGVLFPGSRQPFKIWPVKNYCRVLRKTKGLTPTTWVVCGGNAEAQLCEQLCFHLNECGIDSLNLAGKTTLRELVAVLQGASLYLGSDTMAVHLAAAQHLPAVCVLGGGHYGQFYPYPDNLKTRAVTNELSCFHCNWECIRGEAECISGVTIDQVVDAILSCHKDNLLQNQAFRVYD